MKAIPAALALALLSACANAPHHRSETPLPAGLASFAGAPSLACGYQKTLVEHGLESHSPWHVWRWPDQVQTRDDLSKQGEIWRKDPGGRIFFTRVFYPEQVALEYMPGDLAATGVAPDWGQLQAALVDPRQLGTELRLLGQRDEAGVRVEHYSGKLDGIATELDWLPALGLPARISKAFPERSVSLALQGCANVGQSQPQPLAGAALDRFRHIDFSDLGDMESDPEVQRVVALTGGHHHQH